MWIHRSAIIVFVIACNGQATSTHPENDYWTRPPMQTTEFRRIADPPPRQDGSPEPSNDSTPSSPIVTNTNTGEITKASVAFYRTSGGIAIGHPRQEFSVWRDRLLVATINWRPVTSGCFLQTTEIVRPDGRLYERRQQFVRTPGVVCTDQGGLRILLYDRDTLRLHEGIDLLALTPVGGWGKWRFTFRLDRTDLGEFNIVDTETYINVRP